MNYEGEPTLDFTKMDEAKELSEPVRVVEFVVGGMKLLLPRGVDDTTPDNVLRFNGLELNVDTGEVK